MIFPTIEQYNATLKKDMFLVLDTETLGYHPDAKDLLQKVFDIGYKIIDRNGVEYSKGSFIVKEFYRKTIEEYAFYKEKIEFYDRYIETGYSKVVPFNDIMELIKHECEVYDVQYFVAYNLGFDNRVLNKTNAYLNEMVNELLFDDLVHFDLYHVASQTILNTDKYKRWAIKNLHMNTETMNIKTGAESCFAYLINEPEFIEQHTALSDVEIECQILVKVMANYAHNYDCSINTQSWRIVNEKKAEIIYLFERYHPSKREELQAYRDKQLAKKPKQAI